MVDYFLYASIDINNLAAISNYDMNYKQMRYFVVIAETGSFSNAAERIPLAQSALSRHMRLLEEGLGTKLLLRTGRGIELTEQGEFLFERAKDMLEQKRDVEQTISTWCDHPSGLVRLGMPPTIVLTSAAKIIGTVREAYPAISLNISEHLSNDINRMLLAGRLDLGIVLEPQRSDKMHSELLEREKLCLATASSVTLKAAVRFKDIAAMPLIVPTKYGGLRAAIDRAAAGQDVRFTPTFKLDSLHAIKELVKEGAGVAILTRSAIDPEVKRGEINAYEIAEEGMDVPIHLAYLSDKPLRSAASVTAEIVCKILGSDVPAV